MQQHTYTVRPTANNNRIFEVYFPRWIASNLQKRTQQVMVAQVISPAVKRKWKGCTAWDIGYRLRTPLNARGWKSIHIIYGTRHFPSPSNLFKLFGRHYILIKKESTMAMATCVKKRLQAPFNQNTKQPVALILIHVSFFFLSKHQLVTRKLPLINCVLLQGKKYIGTKEVF